MQSRCRSFELLAVSHPTSVFAMHLAPIFDAVPDQPHHTKVGGRCWRHAGCQSEAWRAAKVIRTGHSGC